MRFRDIGEDILLHWRDIWKQHTLILQQNNNNLSGDLMKMVCLLVNSTSTQWK